MPRSLDAEVTIAHTELQQRAGLLLAQCASGDSDALRALYEAVSPQLFAVLVRILGRRDLAQEALQDVFVRIWRNAASYRPEQAQPLTWMISIARYRAIDLRRRSRREVPLEDAGDIEEPADPAGDPLAEAIRSAAASALAHCVNQLRPEPRRCVRLAYLKGYTHEEVAAAVQSPLGTVKSWIRRGLHSLKECLER